jgi:hypothetical protein
MFGVRRLDAAFHRRGLTRRSTLSESRGGLAVHLASHTQELTKITDVIQMDWNAAIQDGSNLLVRAHGTDDYVRLRLQNMVGHQEKTG